MNDVDDSADPRALPGSAIGLQVQHAESFTARLCGLLGRRGLAEGHALLLQPCSAVHTLGMRFDIDVVFLGPDQGVLKIERGLRPWRFASCRRARSVLELAAGGAARHGIAVGQPLPGAMS